MVKEIKKRRTRVSFPTSGGKVSFLVTSPFGNDPVIPTDNQKKILRCEKFCGHCWTDYEVHIPTNVIDRDERTKTIDGVRQCRHCGLVQEKIETWEDQDG